MADGWVLATTPELTLLAATLALAFVQLLLPAAGRTLAAGLAWNAGPRDGPAPEAGPVTGRLERAQANLYETLPLFIGAVLIAHVSGEDGVLTFWGCQAYFWARLVYVPLYAFGVPYIRSLVWLISVAGLAAVFVALFT